MPILSNPRHERFAQELAKGKSASEAYRLAGYSPDDGNAIRLTGNDKVQTRLRELQRPAVEAAQMTLESLLEELEQARELAMSLEQPAAAVSAIKEKGVLSGLRVEKSERKTIGDARTLSDAELDAAIAAALAREAAEEQGSGLTH